MRHEEITRRRKEGRKEGRGMNAFVFVILCDISKERDRKISLVFSNFGLMIATDETMSRHVYG